LATADGSVKGSEFFNQLSLLTSPLFYLSSNLVSLIGVVLTTSTFFTIVVLYLVDFYRPYANPYIGILAYLILPGLFVLGLLLIPVGMVLQHRREVRRGTLPAKYPQVDFNQPHLRRVFSFVVLATTVNGLVLTTASYRGVQYMDSVTFCGQTCHTVMMPEFSAYQNSPHSRVDCVECHIGAGASWFFRSKLSGLQQVLAVALNDFPRPIPTPIKNLRPARETCERCHWPSRLSGYLLTIRNNYGDDETNHLTKTVLSLKVGGGPAQSRGIHTVHLDLAREITYLATDRQRQVIPWVQYRSVDGTVKEFAASGWDRDKSKGELRTMDCMDCHNRPTHAYQLPGRAVNDAMAAGQMNPSLPFLKKTAVELLQHSYPTRQAGLDALPQAFSQFYQKNYPQVWRDKREQVEQAGAALAAIYGRNVFPEMKVAWGTYPNNIGHQDFPGCFRCHDGDHSTATGETITQDCGACHAVLAYEEDNPKILSALTEGGP
jgi:NapC/NirT cytochrome c family, N-terminal region